MWYIGVVLDIDCFGVGFLGVLFEDEWIGVGCIVDWFEWIGFCYLFGYYEWNIC